MSATGLAAFDSTVQTTNAWLKEIGDELEFNDRAAAYHALRAVTHALRDRLPVEVAAKLGAQLALLVRGVYYEGWHPADKPLRERHREEFLRHIASFPNGTLQEAERAARAVFNVLCRHVSAGEVEIVKKCLPADIRELWS